MTLYMYKHNLRRIWITFPIYLILFICVICEQGKPHRIRKRSHGCRNVNDGKYCYLHDGLLGYRDAEKACENVGRSLLNVNSLAEYVKFLSVVDDQYTVWLSIRRKIHPAWTWVQESEYSQGLPPLGDHGDCGFIDYTTPDLRKTSCSSLWLGYICQTKLEGEACKNFRVGLKQLMVGEKCFRINFEKLNWYEARWRCHIQNMDLAVLDSPEEENELRNGIRENWKIFKLWQFWLGFYRADWVIEEGSNESITKHGVFWDWSQPNNTGDCAVIADQGRYWRTADCAERHRVICQKRDTERVRSYPKQRNVTQRTPPSPEIQFNSQAKDQCSLSQKDRVYSLRNGGSPVWACTQNFVICLLLISVFQLNILEL